MKKLSKLICVFIALCMITSVAIPKIADAAIKISKTKTTIYKDDFLQLKITGTKGKTTWKTDNSKVLKSYGNGKFYGQAEGTANVTATVNKKKYTCKVTVKLTGEQKLEEIYSWSVSEMWNNGIWCLREFYEDGAQETMVAVANKNVAKGMKTLENYNKFISGLKGSQYGDFKEAWDSYYTELTALYETIQEIDWSTGNTGNKLYTDLFRYSQDTMWQELSKLY